MSAESDNKDKNAKSDKSAESNRKKTKEKKEKTEKAERKKVEKAEKEEVEVCTICAAHYTPIIRKRMECKFCKKATCSKCIEQYLLSRHEDAHCVHCRVNYSDETLREICTKTYLSQVYFKHRQEVLMNRERANLPALQEEALTRRKSQEIHSRLYGIRREKSALKKENYSQTKILSLLRRKDSEWTKELYESKDAEEREKIRTRLASLPPQIKEVEQKLKENNARLDQLTGQRKELFDAYRALHRRNDGVDDGANDKDDAKEDRKKFIRRCVRPNCQGFLSQAWKCGICEWYSCSKCYSVRGPNHDSAHECKKEDIETAEMIRKDSKPCPKCGEFINKSSGCSQMYCIVCHTPWDWNTGKIVTSGPIHNPHYYDWLKRNNAGGEVQRNPADVPCGGFPDAWHLRQMPTYLPDDLKRAWTEFHRFCVELQTRSEYAYRNHLDQGVLQQIHIDFLNGKTNEVRWGRLLAMQEKKAKRDREIHDVYAAFRMVGVELINRIQYYRDESVDSFMIVPLERATKFMQAWVAETRGLIAMINDAFRTISLSYAYSVPYIGEESMDGTRKRWVIQTRNWSGMETKRRPKKVTTKQEDFLVDALMNNVLGTATAATATVTATAAASLASLEGDEKEDDEKEEDDEIDFNAIEEEEFEEDSDSDSDSGDLQEALERSVNDH